MSDPERFDRLTRRHRECLRLVRELKGSKEIADILGIEKSTVDGYLAEAVRYLRARDRRDAAVIFHRHEQAVAAIETSLEPPVAHPSKIGGDSARLAAPPAPLPVGSSPDEPLVGASGHRDMAPTARSSGFRLPFRRKGQAGNDLSVGDRLIWIQVIAVGTAVGFGMLATGLQVLTDLLASVTGHLS